MLWNHANPVVVLIDLKKMMCIEALLQRTYQEPALPLKLTYTILRQSLKVLESTFDHVQLLMECVFDWLHFFDFGELITYSAHLL